MFGLGGIYVEILEDVVFKLSPVTTVEAQDMIVSIKAASLLDGVRGQEGIDKEGIVEVILRLSQLVTEQPVIQEIDLNPIVAYHDRIYAVDARISVDSNQ
jgi:acetyltransferase